MLFRSRSLSPNAHAALKGATTESSFDTGLGLEVKGPIKRSIIDELGEGLCDWLLTEDTPSRPLGIALSLSKAEMLGDYLTAQTGVAYIQRYYSMSVESNWSPSPFHYTGSRFILN